jgi:hypothetical protein
MLVAAMNRFLAGHGPDRSGVGVDQCAEDLREDGLGRALLAGHRQQRIGRHFILTGIWPAIKVYYL